MAQSLKIIEMNGVISIDIADIFDGDEIAELAKAYDIEDERIFYEGFWYSFGEGENGVDTFIDENEIEKKIERGYTIDNIVSEFESRGFCADLIQTSSGEIDMIDYIESDEFDDDNLELGFNPYMGTYDYDC